MPTSFRQFQRVATRFNRLFVRVTPHKADTADYGNYAGQQLVVFQAPPGQTANILEVQSSAGADPATGAVLMAVDASGNVAVSSVTACKKCVAQYALTSAQIKTMYTTPVTVVPAPGAGLAIVNARIVLQTKNTATQYTGGGVITFVYHGGSINPHDAADSIAAAVMTSATGSVNQMAPISAAIQPPVNTGIDITNATAVFATGTGTAIVTVTYDLLTLG